MAALVFARHVVVDGSNIATEGRSMPSLAQLDEAVREYRREFPDDTIVVVVDATFGHRIEESERQAFDEAVAHNEIVSPPAGAIGRGDAFLLRIAEKVGATVLSNDSFQEFHGEYEWLFTNGRLIGGKPVPGVGWIFTPRTPVRGPRSRDAVRTAKRERGARRPRPEEVQKKVEKAIAAATEEVVEPDSPSVKRRRRRRGSSPPAEPVNEPLAFIELVAKYPLGSEIEGEVETFSSHGAFVQAGGARCYIPLAALGDPPPRAAKDVLRKGEMRTFVVQALDPSRRGVELALPEYAHVAGAPSPETVEEEIRRSRETSDDGSGPRRRGRGGRRREEVPAETSETPERSYGPHPEQPAPAPATMPEPATTAAVAQEPGSERQDTEQGRDERAPARAARKRAAARATPPAAADAVSTRARSGRKAAAPVASAPLPDEAPKDAEHSAPVRPTRKRSPAKAAPLAAAPAAPAEAAAPADPATATGPAAVPPVQATRAVRKSRAKAPPAEAPDQAPRSEEAPPSRKAATAKAAAAKKPAASRTAAGAAKAAGKAPAAKKVAAAEKAPAEKAPAGKKAAATRKASLEQAPAAKKTAAAKKAPAAKKTAAAEKAPTEKAPAGKKAPAKKAPPKKAPARKAARVSTT